MSSDLLRQIPDRLGAGDLDWLRERFAAGDLDVLRDHLPADDWAQLGSKLRAGDLPWLRRVVGSVAIPGVGSLAVSPAAAASSDEERPGRRRLIIGLIAGLAVLGVILATVVSSCSGSDETAATTASSTATTAEVTTIADTLAADPRFSTLTRLLGEAGLSDTLAGPGPYTVFAPTDAAFAALPQSALVALAADKELLTKVLTYHVVPGTLKAADLTTGPLTTVQGDPVDVSVDGGTVKVGDATVTRADIAASNGVVHEIDGVLPPPGVDLSTLGAATTAGTTTTATATTTTAGTTSAATTAEAGTTSGPSVDVAGAVGATAELSTLSSLLEQAGLVEALQGPGPLTVFAPTDDAFAALPPKVLEALGKNPDALKQVLTYHVVPQTIAPADFTPGTLETVEGKPLAITVKGGTPYVNGARILSPEIPASNGTVYPIDAVLIPPDLDLTALVGAGAAAAAIDRADYVVFFATGSSTLDTAAQKTVDEAAKAVGALPDGSKVRFIGVADPRGDAAANLQLSLQRVEAVRTALEQAAPGAKVTYLIRARGEQGGASLANQRRVDIVLP